MEVCEEVLCVRRMCSMRFVNPLHDAVTCSYKARGMSFCTIPNQARLFVSKPTLQITKSTKATANMHVLNAALDSSPFAPSDRVGHQCLSLEPLDAVVEVVNQDDLCNGDTTLI